MRWWNRKSAGSPSSSSSSPSSAASSPGSARSRSKDLHFWTRRGDSQRRLTRLSELDRLAEIDLGGRSFDSSNADPRSGSLPTASRSSLSNLDSNPGRTVSALVLLPRPLPLPESATPAAASPRRDPTQVPASGFGFPSPNSACCRLPSPIELTKRLEGNEGTRVATEVSSVMEPLRDRTFPAGEIGSICYLLFVDFRLPHQISSRNSEPTGISRNGFAFRRQKKLSQDPNYNGTAAFRLNIPAKSAPTSGFSSPVHSPLYSPRRLSNVDFSTFNIATPGRQVWPSLEIPFNESLPYFSQKIIPSPDHSPLRSPTVRSPDPKPWNLSAPSSPLNTRMLSDNFAASHENGSNVNGHPLPLPPGAISPSHSGSSHQNGVKPEALKSQWKKGKLIGSGTFGNVYEATNRHTGALCAMKEVNIIPGDAKSAECITQLEQEIKFLSQFEHPNIVQYYGSETIDDQFYIYLEYVHPGSINKYVRQHCGAVTESVVRSFTGHILKGLAYLHSKNIMHRSVSYRYWEHLALLWYCMLGISLRLRSYCLPCGIFSTALPFLWQWGNMYATCTMLFEISFKNLLCVLLAFKLMTLLNLKKTNACRDIKGANLLVDVHGVVKLADFGMAKHLSGAAGALSLKGSPYWMAPEEDENEIEGIEAGSAPRLRYSCQHSIFIFSDAAENAEHQCITGGAHTEQGVGEREASARSLGSVGKQVSTCLSGMLKTPWSNSLKVLMEEHRVRGSAGFGIEGKEGIQLTMAEQLGRRVMQATLNKDIGYDLAVDIWSLGCTIIEMFTGKQPWNGLEGDWQLALGEQVVQKCDIVAAAMFKVLHKDPPIPESLSNEGKDFLRSCFRRNPAERPTALKLLEHPFIRFFHYNYNILGNPEGIPGSKTIENTASPREKSKSRSELCVKGKNSCNGENCHSHLETFETATFPVPQSASEISRSMPSPQQIHLRLSSASDPVNTLNGVPLDTGNFQLYALPKSHEQVH
ncbi:hypothetical protein ZIOFF_055800 [Zingiber officinale]|uniref:mitogen-activated protein kinase kinase kinase n=1 Tax=Zingiber officinale TaxID=94328 RepID=A0A8J5FH41_ZINOF|nr:hypothetical protein ZIOFF_055800 [Zingiber officinale]